MAAPTLPPPDQNQMPSPAPKRAKWPYIAAGSAGGLIVLAVLALISLGSTFTMNGSITTLPSFSGDTCKEPGEWFGGPVRGSRVAVYRTNGELLGVSRLRSGTETGNLCVYPFQVTGLPGGEHLYIVQIDKLGQIPVSGDNADTPRLRQTSYGY